MTKLLYWVVYNLDLGPFGPKVLEFAVRSWLRGARESASQPAVRRRALGFLTVFHLQPSIGADEKM